MTLQLAFTDCYFVIVPQGVFNSESIWSEEPPPLPAVTGHKTRVKATEAKQDFQKTMTSASTTAASLNGTAMSVASVSASATLAPFYGDIRVPPPLVTVLTTSGLKSASPSEEELTINQTLTGSDDAAPCNTFKGGSEVWRRSVMSFAWNWLSYSPLAFSAALLATLILACPHGIDFIMPSFAVLLIDYFSALITKVSLHCSHIQASALSTPSPRASRSWLARA